MKNLHLTFLAAILLFGSGAVRADDSEKLPAWKSLFNGKDLDGWVDVNTSPETWSVKDGLLVCKGKPIGVMRSEKQYENFILHIEWKHTQPGGNSGVFVWSDGKAAPKKRLPKGVEVQMLEIDWPKLHKRKDGTLPPVAYVHGEVWGTNGLHTTPDNPRGNRSMSIENRCKPRGQWNYYDVVCVDGVIKLSVNGKFVNGISKATQKKGYLCLESEGAEIHFRNIRILELPPGVTTKDQTAPLEKGKADASAQKRSSNSKGSTGVRKENGISLLPTRIEMPALPPSSLPPSPTSAAAKEAVPALAEALKDEDKSVREAAQKALVQIKGQK